MQVRVCRPARQVAHRFSRGHLGHLRRSARAACGWVTVCGWPVLIMLFMRFRSRDALLLMDFLVPSSSRRGDQEGSHGVERRDIEAFRADVELVRPRRGDTSATLDRGHVEGRRRRGYPPPVRRAPGRRPPAGPGPPPQHAYPSPYHRVLVGRTGERPSQQDFCGTRCEHHSEPHAPAPGIVTIYSAQPECLRSAHTGRISQSIAPTSGKCSCRLPVTRSGESNADARVASQIAATLTAGTQMSQ